MQDRPDAHELAVAVAQFLFEQVRPAVPAELRFQVLVAANACAILARETAQPATARAAEAERLERLGSLLPSGVQQNGGTGERRGDEAPACEVAAIREAQRDVARTIRAGALDDRWDEALAVMRDSVRAKLAVAHPGYDDFADDGRG